EQRVAALSGCWCSLAPVLRRKHLTFVRRNLQRLSLLIHKVPIPPSALLDRAWSNENHDEAFHALVDAHLASGSLAPRTQMQVNDLWRSRPFSRQIDKITGD